MRLTLGLKDGGNTHFRGRRVVGGVGPRETHACSVSSSATKSRSYGGPGTAKPRYRG
jgi:hypothetical protein